MKDDDDDGKKGVQSHRANHIVPALDDTSRDMTTRYINEYLIFHDALRSSCVLTFCRSIDSLAVDRHA